MVRAKTARVSAVRVNAADSHEARDGKNPPPVDKLPELPKRAGSVPQPNRPPAAITGADDRQDPAKEVNAARVVRAANAVKANNAVKVVKVAKAVGRDQAADTAAAGTVAMAEDATVAAAVAADEDHGNPKFTKSWARNPKRHP